jgi:tetratricopeptide (TPR) repeat protein
VKLLGALLLAAVAATGCARALREPPPLTDLGGGARSAPASSVETLLSSAESLFASRLLNSVREASQVWLQAARADSRRIEGLVGAARANVWLADHEEGLDARREVAQVAVQAAQWCGRIAKDDPRCDFWLGAALGVQARERHSTALDALPKIEEAFKRAAAAAPEMEEAGPDRALALLYARAPGWPTGPGDPDLSLEHARKAVAIRPEFPPNELALAEALAATDDGEGSRRTYELALKMARELAGRGDKDAPEWIEEGATALKGQRGD